MIENVVEKNHLSKCSRYDLESCIPENTRENLFGSQNSLQLHRSPSTLPGIQE